ncbi:MAG: hypothetical protein U0894_18675 [Pirellulales bacterium]
MPASFVAGALGLSLLAGLSSDAFADPPARFQPPAGIRQVPANSVRISDSADDATSEEVETSSNLRWKTKSPATSQTTARPVQTAPASTAKRTTATGRIAPVAYNQPASGRTAGWNKSRIDSTVMPAQYSAPGADPFRDPFGDRLAQSTNRAPQLAPEVEDETIEVQEAAPMDPSAPIEPMDPEVAPQEESEMELPARPMPPAARGNTPVEPMEVPMEVPMEEQPIQRPMPPSRGTLNLRPMAPAGTLPPPTRTQKRLDCDRIYNERNCCEADDAVELFRQQLVTDDITKISLDISPRSPWYMPDRDEADDSVKRDDLARKSGSRKWMSHQGEVLATGHLSGFRYGRVEVADEAGNVVARLNPQQLGSDELCFVSGWYRIPMEGIVSTTEPLPRNWLASTYAWHASALCHKPLYFEEVQAERYGHTHGPFKQPFVSGAHFFVNVATLPYKMAINPPNECQYALGYYRPGSCAPYHIMPVPLSVRAGLVEAGAIVGGIALLP